MIFVWYMRLQKSSPTGLTVAPATLNSTAKTFNWFFSYLNVWSFRQDRTASARSLLLRLLPDLSPTLHTKQQMKQIASIIITLL
jgi:hypothetical protein